MRRGLLLIVLCTSSIMLFAEDIFLKKYEQAKLEYKNGNYAEAQRKFISIAEVNGNYLDVWDKIKECNLKIAEKQNRQAKEIRSLDAEKERLAIEKGKTESELRSQIAGLKGEVLGQSQVLTQRNDSITKLNGALDWLNDSISSLNTQLNNLSIELKSVILEKDSINLLFLQENSK